MNEDWDTQRRPRRPEDYKRRKSDHTGLLFAGAVLMSISVVVSTGVSVYNRIETIKRFNAIADSLRIASEGRLEMIRTFDDGRTQAVQRIIERLDSLEANITGAPQSDR